MIGEESTHLNEFIKGKRNLNEDLAIKLEKHLGIPFKTWMNLHKGYVYDCKALEELFARKKVNIIDKYVHSGNLSVKFEVYLKKLYYMLHGKEIQPTEEGKKVTLASCILVFPCLKRLRWSTKETEQKLSGYLDIIRNNRNTSDGNGTHSSYLLTEQQLDGNIKEFVTLHVYVTGMCLNKLT